MINHLLRFDDEAAARAALPDYLAGDGWRLEVVVPGQRVVLARATFGANFKMLTPEQTAPGYYLTISAPALLPDLLELPGDACRLVGRSTSGEILYLAPDIDPELFASAIVEPLPAGAKYRFGPGGA